MYAFHGQQTLADRHSSFTKNLLRSSSVRLSVHSMAVFSLTGSVPKTSASPHRDLERSRSGRLCDRSVDI